MWLRGLFGGGGYGLTKAQPENNIMRGAFYALGAALGGAQTIALCSFDEAYTIPTPRAAMLSLRTLQLIMDEVGLRDTVDPLAGSYFIETLTKEMEGKIRAEMAEVEKWGGMVKAVDEGIIQKKMAAQAFAYEKALQEGELTKVGVNRYVMDEEELPEVELHEYDMSTQDRQIDRLREVRQSRDGRAAAARLKDLERITKAGENVMPVLVECCKAYCTLGEMTGVFREVFGEFREPGIF